MERFYFILRREVAVFLLEFLDKLDFVGLVDGIGDMANQVVFVLDELFVYVVIAPLHGLRRFSPKPFRRLHGFVSL